MPKTESTHPEAAHRAGALVRWLRGQRLLRGPFLFTDYWANVLRLGGIIPERHVRDGLIDPALFRLGIDRPDIELPRFRHYPVLFIAALLLLPLRSFRRLSRYWPKFERGVRGEVRAALDRYRLSLIPAGPGRVHVRKGEHVLARDVLDPYRISGFCSLFWAANKIPFASLTAILIVAIAAPLVSAAGSLAVVEDYWIPVGVPLLVLLLYLTFRDWATALFGALPLVFGRYLLSIIEPGRDDWAPFFWSLAGLFALYLLADWFFLPRPVPPALLLYTADGPGRPYARDQDAPYWLEGRCYWVWRYLIFSPAELNKFWERDWERVDLWIRADGADAGMLEWVVTDMHYREIWIPYARLGTDETLAAHRTAAIDAVRSGRSGIWLLEVDVDIIVHYPFFRTVSFLPETGSLPARSVLHALGALWKRARDEDVDANLQALDRVRLRLGKDILGDVPEVAVRRASRHLVSQPWRYWRYPLGAGTREEARLYGYEAPVPPPAAADPELQIKVRDARS
ncbi:MAG TPA: hypothetical protein VF188_06990 [Longimicrobiales bacterium]